MAGPIEVADRRVTGAELSKVALFGDVPSEDLAELASHFVELRVLANQVVYRQGEPATSFFIVKSGALAVFRDAIGQPVQLLARLHRDDFFGEIALFGTGQATASVRASEPSELWRVGADGFVPFVERHPAVQLHLQMVAARRHTDNLASVLETGRRREVRIRCKQPVPIHLVDGSRLEVVLENLSLGGVCLHGAPESWRVGDEVSFGMALREGLLQLRGSVRWRLDDSVGVSFDKQLPNHDMLIQMAIRLILESAL